MKPNSKTRAKHLLDTDGHIVWLGCMGDQDGMSFTATSDDLEAEVERGRAVLAEQFRAVRRQALRQAEKAILARAELLSDVTRSKALREAAAIVAALANPRKRK